MKQSAANVIHNSKILYWLRYIVYGLIVVFLAGSLLSGWEQVQQYEWHFSVGRLALAFFLQAAYFASNGFFWIWLVRRMDMDLPYTSGFSIYVVTRLSKYIPGGVWPFASVAAMGKQQGLSATRMVASLILTNVLVVWVSALFSVPIVLIVGVVESTAFNYLIAIGLIVATVLAPWLLRWVFVKVVKWRMLAEIDAVMRLAELRLMAFVFLVFVALYMIQLLSFYTFLTAIIDIPVSDGIYSTFSWNAAWLVGFLVLIVPSGMGVREASLTVLLQRVMPTSIATAIGVGHRLFFTTFDMLILVIYLGARYLGSRKSDKTD